MLVYAVFMSRRASGYVTETVEGILDEPQNSWTWAAGLQESTRLTLRVANHFVMRLRRMVVMMMMNVNDSVVDCAGLTS